MANSENFRLALELEKRLRVEQRKKPFMDPTIRALRKSVREAYEAALFEDYAFAQANDAELCLWKMCYYRPIEEFRARIKIATGAATGTAPVAGTTPEEAARQLLKTQTAYRNFLSDSIVNYKSLAARLQATYGDLGVDLQLDPGTAAQVAAHKAAVAARRSGEGVRTVNCHASVHRCLIYLGDLYRYMAQIRHEDPQQQPRERAEAMAYYHLAARVLPSSGNPFNQLAVMAYLLQQELTAVYYYYRALGVSSPFTTARENLLLLFESNRNRYTQLQAAEGTGAAPGRLAELSIRYVRLAALLYDRINLHTLPDVRFACAQTLKASLADPTLLLTPAAAATVGCAPTTSPLLQTVGIVVFGAHMLSGGSAWAASQAPVDQSVSAADLARTQQPYLKRVALTALVEMAGCLCSAATTQQLTTPASGTAGTADTTTTTGLDVVLAPLNVLLSWLTSSSSEPLFPVALSTPAVAAAPAQPGGTAANGGGAGPAPTQQSQLDEAGAAWTEVTCRATFWRHAAALARHLATLLGGVQDSNTSPGGSSGGGASALECALHHPPAEPLLPEESGMVGYVPLAEAHALLPQQSDVRRPAGQARDQLPDTDAAAGNGLGARRPGGAAQSDSLQRVQRVLFWLHRASVKVAGVAGAGQSALSQGVSRVALQNLEKAVRDFSSAMDDIVTKAEAATQQQVAQAKVAASTAAAAGTAPMQPAMPTVAGANGAGTQSVPVPLPAVPVAPPAIPASIAAAAQQAAAAMARQLAQASGATPTAPATAPVTSAPQAPLQPQIPVSATMSAASGRSTPSSSIHQPLPQAPAPLPPPSWLASAANTLQAHQQQLQAGQLPAAAVATSGAGSGLLRSVSSGTLAAGNKSAGPPASVPLPTLPTTTHLQPAHNAASTRSWDSQQQPQPQQGAMGGALEPPRPQGPPPEQLPLPRNLSSVQLAKQFSHPAVRSTCSSGSYAPSDHLTPMDALHPGLFRASSPSLPPAASADAAHERAASVAAHLLRSSLTSHSHGSNKQPHSRPGSATSLGMAPVAGLPPMSVHIPSPGGVSRHTPAPSPGDAPLVPEITPSNQLMWRASMTSGSQPASPSPPAKTGRDTTPWQTPTVHTAAPAATAAGLPAASGLAQQSAALAAAAAAAAKAASAATGASGQPQHAPSSHAHQASFTAAMAARAASAAAAQNAAKSVPILPTHSAPPQGQGPGSSSSTTQGPGSKSNLPSNINIPLHPPPPTIDSPAMLSVLQQATQLQGAASHPSNTTAQPQQQHQPQQHNLSTYQPQHVGLPYQPQGTGAHSAPMFPYTAQPSAFHHPAPAARHDYSAAIAAADSVLLPHAANSAQHLAAGSSRAQAQQPQPPQQQMQQQQQSYGSNMFPIQRPQGPQQPPQLPLYQSTSGKDFGTGGFTFLDMLSSQPPSSTEPSRQHSRQPSSGLLPSPGGHLQQPGAAGGRTDSSSSFGAAQYTQPQAQHSLAGQLPDDLDL